MTSGLHSEVLTKLDSLRSQMPPALLELVAKYLKNASLEEQAEQHKTMVSIWDFAGQHLYYASHVLFMCPRAVYLLCYNMSKRLQELAKPCVRQGSTDYILDNENSQSNLDNLLAWFVSVHSVARGSYQDDTVGYHGNETGAFVPYITPPVLVVGTHVDCPDVNPDDVESVIKSSLRGKEYANHAVRPFFRVDNTRSSEDPGVQLLKKKMAEVLRKEFQGRAVPLR